MGRDPGGVDVEAKRDGVDLRIRFGGKFVCDDRGRSLMFDASCFVLEGLEAAEAAWGRDCMDWPTDPSSLGCMEIDGSGPFYDGQIPPKTLYPAALVAIPGTELPIYRIPGNSTFHENPKASTVGEDARISSGSFVCAGDGLKREVRNKAPPCPRPAGTSR